MESPQIESRDGASLPIVSCCDIVLVALAVLVPFLVNLGEYPDA